MTTTSSTTYIDPIDKRNVFIDLIEDYIILIIVTLILFCLMISMCRSLIRQEKEPEPIIYDNISEYPKEICIDTLTKNNCSICLDEFTDEQILMTNCEHIYHYKCIKDWKTKSNKFTCPLCRDNINKMYEI